MMMMMIDVLSVLSPDVRTYVCVCVWQGNNGRGAVSCCHTVSVLARLLCTQDQQRSPDRHVTYLYTHVTRASSSSSSSSSR